MMRLLVREKPWESDLMVTREELRREIVIELDRLESQPNDYMSMNTVITFLWDAPCTENECSTT